MADWRDRAACRTVEPEVFFPLSEVGAGAVQVARAKTVCQTCPVILACRRFAFTEGLDHGVFGGMSESERRAVRAAALRREAGVTR